MTPTAATPPRPSATEQLDAHPLTRNQRRLITLVALGNVAEFFDLFLIGFVVTFLTKPWHLTGLETGTILAFSGLGTVLGAVLWGRLADRIGRRRSFQWCLTIFVLFTAASVLTPDRAWFLLALLRVGVGLGVGGLNITSIPYVQELVPARRRGLLAGLASVFIPLGLLLGSQAQLWLGALIGWRGLVALGCVPLLLLLWVRRVPESPRFLQTRGDEHGARASLAWAMERPVDEVGPLEPQPAATRTPYALVLSEQRRSLLVVTAGSFAFVLGSFTIQSWGQTLLQDGFGVASATVGALFSLVSVADCAGRLTSAWLADRWGRRRVLLVFGLLGAVGCVIAGLAPSAAVFFVGILVAMTFGDGAFGILNAFGAEQFPTPARATGLGLGYGLGATAKVVGPFLLGALIGGSAVKQNVTRGAVPPAFLLFAVLLVVGALVYQLAHETRGAPLDRRDNAGTRPAAPLVR